MPSVNVKTGLQVLVENDNRLSGARIGLVTHPAAVMPDYCHSLDALLGAGVRIGALFGPEHGYLGFEPDAAQVAHTFDLRTGLPVYSLYGERFSPSPVMLKDLDVLLFDMQDAGCRFYTFISTLYHILQTAGKHDKPVIILDRPNPLGGFVSAGPMIDLGYESFVGITSMPVLHGMTVGELGGWMNTRLELQADLMVIPMQGWRREMRFDDTGLPWVPTSPGIPHTSAVYVYPCTCFIEGTNYSEGRGTALPFEQFGAPWVDGYLLARALNNAGIDGLCFRPAYFQPSDGKHRGKTCQGVQVHITDPQAFQPVTSMLRIIEQLIRIDSQFRFIDTSWEGVFPHFDLLIGNGAVRRQLLAGVPAAGISADWHILQKRFEEDRAPFLFYP